MKHGVKESIFRTQLWDKEPLINGDKEQNLFTSMGMVIDKSMEKQRRTQSINTDTWDW
jgi:hypothetical protein